MQLTIEKHLQVPMRDGVLLATDVYRPAGAGPFPVVMMRLPYNKEQPALLFLAGDILRVAQAGYAVVVQDCRGTWASEGEFSPYFQEAEDGADAIAWAKQQGHVKGDPLIDSVAAVSVGIIDGEPRLDLHYDDDVRAETDMNVVMTGSGTYVEVQGTAEGEPFDRRLLDQLLDLAAAGCVELTALQRAALAS